MSFDTVSHCVLLFFVYACLGWMVEVAYAAFTAGKLLNRGFLNGPFCPIYGFGMVGLVLLFDKIGHSLPEVFLVGVLVPTGIELVGGWALYEIFHARWWDYSKRPYNFKGFICLRFSLLWGVGSVIMMKIVHPALNAAINLLLPIQVQLALGCVGILLMLLDVAVSAAEAIGLNKRLQEIDSLRAQMRAVSDKMTSVIGTRALTADEMWDSQKLQMTLAMMEGKEDMNDLRQQLMSVQQRTKLLHTVMDKAQNAAFFGRNRMLNAFSELVSTDHNEALRMLREGALYTNAEERVKAAMAYMQKK